MSRQDTELSYLVTTSTDFPPPHQMPIKILNSSTMSAMSPRESDCIMN